jgi:putative Mg2+ transporter-C (MgtC) family protein
MDQKRKSDIDPVRVTQRVLKFVLVPAVIAGGCIFLCVDVIEDPSRATPVVRLAVAAGLGGLLGVERTMSGHWAGLRTHMMVALGAAIFTIVGAKMGPDADATRVVQGIAAGIGFLGAGTILKLSDRMEVVGLTTASSIWLAASIGTAAGQGLYTIGVAGTVLSLLVLAAMLPVERKFLARRLGKDRVDDQPTG